jgi:hypothetical protein
VLTELARLLEPLGIRPNLLRYRLDVTPLKGRTARLASRITSAYAALHPFASKQNRCVALGVWIELSRQLSVRGLSTLWIGSGAELDELRLAANKVWWHFIDRDDGTLADTAAALSAAAPSWDTIRVRCTPRARSAFRGRHLRARRAARTFPQGVGKSKCSRVHRRLNLCRRHPGGDRRCEVDAQIRSHLHRDDERVGDAVHVRRCCTR